jgi:hypothetical protein
MDIAYQIKVSGLFLLTAFMVKRFCQMLLCLCCCVGASGQSLSLSNLEDIYACKSADQINAYLRKLKWEGNTTYIRDNAFEVSLQFNNVEDIMVKQDSSGFRFISYRLHSEEDVLHYQQNSKNFKHFELLPSQHENVKIYRRKDVLQQLTMNNTRGILTILYEERPDVSFWNDLIDRNSHFDPYEVGTYMASEGGVLVGKSADGTEGYIVAMEDAKHGNGCSWSSAQVMVRGTFTASDWYRAHTDLDGAHNSKAVYVYVLGNKERQPRAVQLACDFTGGGKTDWYLPSIGQLKMISDNMADINASLKKNGGISIAKTWYWSSTQYNDRMAWSCNFATYMVGPSAKDGHDRVRAVRTIKLGK